MSLRNLGAVNKFGVPCTMVVSVPSSPSCLTFPHPFFPPPYTVRRNVTSWSPSQLSKSSSYTQDNSNFNQFSPRSPLPLLRETGNEHHCLKSERVLPLIPLPVQREMIQATGSNLFDSGGCLGFAWKILLTIRNTVNLMSVFWTSFCDFYKGFNS